MNIQLFDYQIPCFEKASAILQNNKFCFIISEMGSGKSIVALKIAEKFKKVIVISEPNVINQNWKLILKNYKLDFELLSINVIRGMKNSKLNHKYLKRKDKPFEKPKAVFRATPDWLNICNPETLIIIDEIQIIKNNNLGYYAIKCLIESGDVKVLALSGTPVDKTEQIENYYDLLGVNKLNIDIHSFVNTFLKQYSCGMQACNAAFQGFIKILPQTVQETSKLDYIISEVHEKYYKNNKIIIAVYFRNSIEYLINKLKNYKPVVICGDTATSDRKKIISGFQSDSNDCKLLIANINIISTGINLDDQTGNYPRICYAILNDQAMILHQLRFRITRVTTKSLSEIYLVCDSSEIKRILNIEKKSEIMNNVIKSVFPNDFELI